MKNVICRPCSGPLIYFCTFSLISHNYNIFANAANFTAGTTETNIVSGVHFLFLSLTKIPATSFFHGASLLFFFVTLTVCVGTRQSKFLKCENVFS